MKEDLLTEEALQAIVRGQLKATIHAHGPIQGSYIGSAARRIANDVLGHLRQMSLQDLSNASASLEVERLRNELKQAQDLVGKKQEQINDLKAKLNL